MRDAILLRVSITSVKSISEDEERGGSEKKCQGETEGEEGQGRKQRENREETSWWCDREGAKRGRDADWRKNCKRVPRGAEGKIVCGAAGGRGRPYTANPRQPHSITMLSRIQMTVISFGTPYT